MTGASYRPRLQGVRPARTVAVAAVAGLALAAGPATAQELFRFTGTAYAGSEQPVYEEQHQVRGQCLQGRFRPEQHEVRYVDVGSGETIGSKQLTYPGRLTQPEVRFELPSWQQSLVITSSGNGELRVESRERGNLETARVEISDAVVVDAGFDHLVREHWSTLLNGESVPFRFLAPSRGEHYSFELEPEPGNDYHLAVTIRPSGLMMRLLVDPIVLGYDRTGALVHYAGLTNIPRTRDQNHEADIRYQVTTQPACPLLSPQ
ncbi:hypothetical protein [Marinobacter xestospongiae]|uniref:Uncharacterized protein n=1 Tax=Marinobacter xestospongiae TaxID=994319 RepID=A0ABU3W007_9GAMM|nr:hypothetical protein [Marinobacter xestospongiae]MDV2079872.1 hypothetical protein [Marinobacter xestospongiae]